MIRTFLVLLLVLLANSTQAQTTDYSADVKSVDSIIKALYEVISGDPGTPRDWNRFKNLFTADAKLIPTSKTTDGKFTYAARTPDEYVTLFTTRVKTGFFERELHRTTESFGTVTHAFSTYETRETKDGPPTNRGINSIQLFYDGSRYYVVNIYWCAESLGFALPEKYLGH
jgi:hypothetical protein